jgi:NAD(P)-dependent dehydrogenase (short-subunit alcohol dehydrogenase family)
MRIEGTAAIVTGAGSGMGAATARYLAQRGAKVALLDVKAQSVADIAKDCGGLALGCDVTDEAAMAAALDQAAAKHGPARILVNCAGVADSGSTVKRSGEMKTLAQFRRVLDVNLTGTWNAMRMVAARLREAAPSDQADSAGERGVFVNTASVAGLDYPPGAAPYVAAKAGVVALTVALAREFSVLGIRVMAIAPGLIDTPMLASLDDGYRARMTAGVPFPKRFGEPEEYARLVGEIVGNGMLNGSTIRLDGALRLIV